MYCTVSHCSWEVNADRKLNLKSRKELDAMNTTEKLSLLHNFHTSAVIEMSDLPVKWVSEKTGKYFYNYLVNTFSLCTEVLLLQKLHFFVKAYGRKVKYDWFEWFCLMNW